MSSAVTRLKQLTGFRDCRGGVTVRWAYSGEFSLRT